MASLPKAKKKNIPKSIHEMSKETLQETLRKKKECEVKAQKIVEMLCELHIDEKWFLDSLQFINQCHIDDVFVERAILKICGYPLCKNPIEKVLSQQYRISTRYNKVFDLKERKNFCSSTCYKSALFIKKQLFTSPLWFRDQEVIPKYTLIESSKSSLGEEIVFLPDKINLKNEISESIKSTKNDAHITNITKFKKKDSDINILSDEKVNNFKNQLVLNSEDSTEPKKKENVEIIEKDKSTVRESTVQSKKSILAEEEYATEKFEEPKAGKVSEIKTLNLAVAEIESNLSKLNMHQTEQSVDMKNISHNFTSDNKSVKSSTTLNLSKSKKCKSEDIKNNCGTEFLDSVTKVEKSLFEWFSLDTLFFLFSERQLKEIFREKTTQLRESLNSRLSIATYDEKIEKMIRLYGLLESGSFRNESPRTNLQPLPDYSALQKESKFLEIKVKAFYGGQLEAKNLTAVEKEKEKESGEDNEVSLPLIDSQAQNALRRKIVLDKLNKILPELIKLLNTDYLLQMSEIRKLISTFTLTPHNITFRPLEWTLVGIIIIKLLSLKDKNLDTVLNMESAQNELELILSTYNKNLDYLSALIEKLTDTNNIMDKIGRESNNVHF